MGFFDDIGKAISRPIKSVAKTVSRPVKKVARGVIHNPVAKAGLGVATVATGGMLAPLAMAVSTAGVVDNVTKHGVVAGLKRTASEELATKDPRVTSRAAIGFLPKKLKDKIPVQKLVTAGLSAVPGGKQGLDAIDAAQKALKSGKPSDIVSAAASGLELTGGMKLEHNTAIQSAINRLPKGAKGVVAAAANAVTKLHDATQGKLRTLTAQEQSKGVVGWLIPFGSKGQKLKGRYHLKAGGTKGFLLGANGRIQVGSFARMGS